MVLAVGLVCASIRLVHAAGVVPRLLPLSSIADRIDPFPSGSQASSTHKSRLTPLYLLSLSFFFVCVCTMCPMCPVLSWALVSLRTNEIGHGSSQNIGRLSFIILGKLGHLESAMGQRFEAPPGCPRLFDLIETTETR